MLSRNKCAIIANMYKRTLYKPIKSKFHKGKAIVLFGPRRVGKTTLARQLLASFSEADQLYLDCDFETTRAALEPRDLAHLNRVIGSAKCVVIDEAQRVKNIGLTIKILVDNRPDVQIIATGSSSFELASTIKEPLTGRSYQFLLLPLSLSELKIDTQFALESQLSSRLIHGSYPSITPLGLADATEELKTITSGYLLRDITELADLRQRNVLPRLLESLALQIGQEVSYHELANLLDVKSETVERYICLLEQAFIVYRLAALSGNQRKKLSSRKRKVYFYDLGIRNSLIGNFNSLNLRNDVGQLWENFCMNERLKINQLADDQPSRYYWRGLYGEVDLVEERAGHYEAFEFKFTNKTATTPKYFAEAYPEAKLKIIHKDNIVTDFLKVTTKPTLYSPYVFGDLSV